MSDFKIKNDKFLLDDSEFKLISGALHYFRIPVDYWRDRLEKLLLMGCNTVETYVPWNMHEPYKDEYNFKDTLDLEKFIDLAHELSIWVIIRPTPYICGEFEFGGIPWWLLKDRDMRLRSTYKGFTNAIDSFYDELIPRIESRQISNGGSIIAVQIENEYGYFSQDKEYLLHLKDSLLSRGITVPLFTSDGPWGNHYEDGGLSGVLQTGNFGSSAKSHFKKMKKVHPDKPLVCMEFWMGWFDAWGDEHHTRDPEDAAKSLEEVLEEGHVNFYMLHGGTNWGFTSGANFYDKYKPDVTSYDYDAPISESGELTAKFYAFKKVILKFKDISEIKLSTKIETLKPHSINKTATYGLFLELDSISTPIKNSYALTMEDLDQGYGYINYQFQLKESDKDTELDLSYCADRAILFVDKKRIKSIDVNTKNKVVKLDIKGVQTIDILVENQGRVNFGPKMNYQRKGFDGPILVNHCEISPVIHYPLPFTTRPELVNKNDLVGNQPGFHRFEFKLELDKNIYQDAFLDMEGWGKGIVFVNGFNIGRFWEVGPQLSLYIPGPLFKDGDNEIIIFETEGKFNDSIDFLNQPKLG